MRNKISPLEESSVESNGNNKRRKSLTGFTSREIGNMILFGSVIAGACGAAKAGAFYMAGQDVGIVSAVLSSIIPLEMGFMGYNMPHLSRFTNPYSEGEYKLSEKLASAGEHLFYGIIMNTVLFGIGAVAGYSATLSNLSRLTK
jgi:hypothetical protein